MSSPRIFCSVSLLVITGPMRMPHKSEPKGHDLGTEIEKKAKRHGFTFSNRGTARNNDNGINCMPSTRALLTTEAFALYLKEVLESQYGVVFELESPKSNRKFRL